MNIKTCFWTDKPRPTIALLSLILTLTFSLQTPLASQASYLPSQSICNAWIKQSDLHQGQYVTYGCPYNGQWNFNHKISYTNYSGRLVKIVVDYYTGESGYPDLVGVKNKNFDDRGETLNGTQSYSASSSIFSEVGFEVPQEFPDIIYIVGCDNTVLFWDYPAQNLGEISSQTNIYNIYLN